jgi:photosystem II stability/assembly factor-like uncharacterized protein
MKRLMILALALAAMLALNPSVTLAVWQPQNSGTTVALYGVAALSEQKAVSVGASGTILRTDNGGNLWSPVASGVTISLMAVYFLDEDYGWCCGQNGTILASTDGGQTWSAQSSGITQFIYYVHFVDSLTGWACGQQGFVLHTTNAGQTWTIQPTGSTMALWSIRFANDQDGWTVGQSGTILYTDNGGQTWNPQVSGSTAYLQSVFCVDEDTVFAAGANGTVLKTTNGGQTWAPCVTGNTSWLYQIYFSDANHGWAVARYGIIYATYNGGDSWVTQYDAGSTTLVYRGVSMVNNMSGWVSGTAGTIMHTFNGGIISPLTISLTPLNPPIIIPPGGGSFDYQLKIRNETDSTVTYDFWMNFLLPNGSLRPIRQRDDLILAAQDSLERNLTQTIPGSAPPGIYTYRAFVGEYPDVVWDMFSFTFVVLAGDLGGPLGSDWRLCGWDASPGLQAEISPAEVDLAWSSPNPFNPATQIRYRLAEQSDIQLSVYDLQGKRLAVLVDGVQGAGQHAATFDASAYPSGLYFYLLRAGANVQSGKMVLLK